MGSPICTAEVGEVSLSASEEKVAPWMPSLPIRPPTMTARSPARTSFHTGVPPSDPGGQHAARAAEHQGLAEVALVEEERPGNDGDAGLVAAVHDAAMHALQHAPRVEQARRARRRRSRVRGAEAEHIRVEDRPRPDAGAQDVAVDPDDARDGAAVGIEGRRGVVRLHLEADQRATVEGDHPGVVVEHRAQEPAPAGHLLRGGADVGSEERVDHLLVPSSAIADGGVEDLVLAVLRPGLGDHLQLHVRGGGGEPMRRSVRSNLFPGVITLDREHLFGGRAPGASRGKARPGNPGRPPAR